MTGRRKYDEACAISHGLDLIGERWALLIVRELLLGPKRFTDLRAGIPAASADMLTSRLRELEQAGILVRHRQLYELTGWGYDLEPLIMQLARWSSRSPQLRADGPIGVDSLVLALRALFDPQAAQDFSVSVGLRLEEQDFHASVTGGEFQIGRGHARNPSLAIATDTATLSQVLWQNVSLAAAQRSENLRLDGDRAAAKRFLSLFPLPQ